MKKMTEVGSAEWERRIYRRHPPIIAAAIVRCAKEFGEAYRKAVAQRLSSLPPAVGSEKT